MHMKETKKGYIVPPTKHYLFQIDRLLVWSVLSIQYSNGLHIENTNYNVLSAIIRITYPFRSIMYSYIILPYNPIVYIQFLNYRTYGT